MERDALIERLAEATPVRDADLATPTVIRLVEELGCSIAVGDGSGARPSASDRPRRRRRWAALAAVALALAVATAALADEFSARTGWFGNPEHTEDDGSEWLRTNASDFGAVARSLVPREIPLPPGVDWSTSIDHQVAAGREHPGLMQETGVRMGFAFFARCAWVASWLDAHESGDTAREARAVAVLESAGDWRPIAVEDGEPDYFATTVVAAGRRGDAAPLRQEFAANCTGLGLGSGR